MKILLKNADVVNVFTDMLIQRDVLIENDKIIGVDQYQDTDADIIEDLSGKVICPGFIDTHIHIESSMMVPEEFSKISLLHGTTAVLADPHEIANVCGKDGIHYMLQAAENLPQHFYFMVPSCVPASDFDESGAKLTAENIAEFYCCPNVLGLAEMMNYPGVINGNPETLRKIQGARSKSKLVNGHAPGLSGHDLDKYISAGIYDEHECESYEEALEKLQKGQWILIRQGTSAKNLRALMPLFNPKTNHRCCFCTDDKNAADLISKGHIDAIIRQAVKWGASPATAIRMATLQAAQCIGLTETGAVAPGYQADLLILDSLPDVMVRDVYISGKKVVDDGMLLPFESTSVHPLLQEKVRQSFHTLDFSSEDFHIEPQDNKCRIIKLVKNGLITEEWQTELDFDQNNGIDTDRDILKCASIERHKGTGHIGLGFVHGFALKQGAVASSISHDSHNLIALGTNDADIAAAAKRVIQLKGGIAVVHNGKVLAEIPLPVGGLMSDQPAEIVAEQNHQLKKVLIEILGADPEYDTIMNMGFLSLLVIPHLKLSTKMLFDVDAFKSVDLFVKEKP